MNRLIILLLLSAVIPIFADSGRVELSQSDMPVSITSPGSYILTENLTGTSGSGITITSDHVTLDLNGFSLRGSGGSTGIFVSGNRKALMIRNGSVVNWSSSGIQAGQADHSMFEDLRLEGNGSNGLNAGDGCLVRNAVAHNNTGQGLRVGDESIVVDCASRDSTSFGVQSGDGTVIRRVTARENNEDGIRLGSQSLALDCTTRNNSGDGVQAGLASVIIASTAYQNGQSGFRVTGPGSLLRDNTAFGNGQYGYRLAAYALLQENAARLNGQGVLATNFSMIVDNVVDSSTNGPGITVVGYGVRIDKNHSVGNTIGFLISQTNNLIIRNTAANNSTTNYSFSAGVNHHEIVVNPGTADSNFDEPWASFDLN